ncbi:MAG: TetR/AcrR family transcriptional regulator [Gammaproteobacteria bacterium]|nr:TetR/AcrR family transcriptional regulator [Gammaproteobacteria bacterium]
MNDITDKDVYWWRPLDDHELDTRDIILFAAYKEIHCQGFQSASLSHILARTGVTKGALYHHFPNKIELGYAVVDEVISQHIHLSFVEPLQNFENPIDGIIELIQRSGDAFSMTDIELGCPLTALAQEMAPIDEGFRSRLIKIYDQWHQSIADGFRRAIDNDQVRDDIDPYTVAVTIVATMEGAINAAKVAQNLDMLYLCGTGLIQYLQLIRKK